MGDFWLLVDSGRTHTSTPHFHFQAMKRHRPTAI
jgi:hypothetical protein